MNDKTSSPIPEWTDDFNQMGADIFKKALDQHAELFKGTTLDPFNLSSIYVDAMVSVLKNPASFIEAQQNFLIDSMRLWAYTTTRIMSGEEVAPVIAPSKGDNRWRDDDWTQNLGV